MRIICFLSLLLCSYCGFAQHGIVVDGAFAIDSASVWKRTDVAAKTFYPVNQNTKINVGYNEDSSVWCRFVISNTSALTQKTWLCFENNHLDSIVLYDTNAIRILGDRTEFVSPFMETQAFALRLQPNQKQLLFAKVKKGLSFFDFSYSLRGEKELAQESRVKMALVSFFLGMIFLLVIFNSVLFYIARKRMHLYYIIYSILSGMYIMISTYYAKYFVFPEFIYFSELRIYTASLWLISMTVFLCHYMDMKKFQPMKYRIATALNVVNISVMTVTILLLMLDQTAYIRIFFFLGYLNFLVIILLILWSAVVNLKIERAKSVYVLLAFFPQSLWGLGIILKSFGFIPKNMHEDALIYICLYEVFLFGYVLAKNYIDTFRENNSLMQEVIWQKENSLHAITQAQIRERRNIANIIHDNLGSKLAYISQLIQLKNHLQANKNLEELSEEIREISHKILPKSLDEGALVSSLNSQINTWNNGLTHTKIELFSFDFPEKINEPWIYDLYLITTEIINNSIKHGRAMSVNIELYDYPESYVFQFTDDGIGFDRKTTPKGFGLENIERRIAFYNGIFEINSAKNDGTVIQISLPKSN